MDALWQLGAQTADTVGPWLIRATRSRLHEQGARVRKRSGTGSDFWQYRPLGDGESRGRIDWRKSARSDDLLVREQERQTSSQLILWCDRSASMDYRSDTQLMSKRDYAYALASTLVHAAAMADDRASALIDAPHITPKFDLPVRLQNITEPMLQRVTNDQLIVLISDFLMPDAGLNILASAERNIVCVHVCDPYEIAFPFTGRTQFVGFENEADVLLACAESTQASYLDAFRDLSRKISTIGLYVRADTSRALAEVAQTIIS